MNNGSHGAISMQDRIFLAGATGAIGTALILLRAAGYEVHGATRNADSCAALEPPARRPS